MNQTRRLAAILSTVLSLSESALPSAAWMTVLGSTPAVRSECCERPKPARNPAFRTTPLSGRVGWKRGIEELPLLGAEDHRMGTRGHS